MEMVIIQALELALKLQSSKQQIAGITDYA
jgi:hypothetical protein